MEYTYDIAISFATEDIEIANELAGKLRLGNVSVFYAEYEEAKLLGENMYEYFSDVYSKKSRYCVMLISKYYVQKSWTKHERKSAQERALKENRAYILPVRIDSTPLPGLHETVLCFDLQRKSIDQLVETILLKLRDINSAHVVTDPIPPLPIIEKTINLQTSEDFISTFFKTLKNEFNEINSIDNLWRLLDALKISSYYNLYDDIQAKYDKIVYGSKMTSNHEKAEYKLYLAGVHTKRYEFDAAHQLLREAIDIVEPKDALYDLLYREYLISGFICYSRKNDTNGLKSLLGITSGVQNEKNSDIDYLLSIIYQEIFTRDINLHSLREVVISLDKRYREASHLAKPAMANSLGLAYRRLGERTGIADLKRAIDIFSDGLVFNKSNRKIEIELKDQKAITHIRIFELNHEINELEQAESLIKDCLELLSHPLDDPKDYRLKPRILNNYGNIYKQKLLVYKEIDDASKAKSKYAEAEQYWNERESKYDWALLKKNIAETNYALGKITNDKYLLLEVIQDCIKSIKYRTLKNSPYQWGKTVRIIFDSVILLDKLNAVTFISKAIKNKILSFSRAILIEEKNWKENMPIEFMETSRKVQAIVMEQI